MKEIEDDDVAAKRIHLDRRDVLFAQIDIAVVLTRHGVTAADFWPINIQSGNGLREPAFSQIERQQPHPAADIQQRRARLAKQLESLRKNGVGA